MPQKSKFTQALEDDANKDKAVKVSLGVVGAGMATAAGLSAKKKTNALKEAVLDRINAGPNMRIVTAKPTSIQGGIAEHLVAEAYKPAATAYQKTIPLNGNMLPVVPTKKNRDARIEAQKKIVPMEEDTVVEQKRAADRRTAIRKGMGQNMARTGKATPWTQPAKSWNFGGASSRFLKSIGYTGPLGLTTKRSAVQPETPRQTTAAPKAKTEMLANIKRNVARAERAPEVTPASSHTGRALQFDKFSKQANSRGWKASPVDAVKIGARSPIGKGAIAGTIATAGITTGVNLFKNVGAGQVVADAKKMAGPTSPTTTASTTKANAPVVDDTKANEWDRVMGAVAPTIKYNMAIKKLDDPRAAAFAEKFRKDNPKLFKK
jgi:hypothetical protein